MLIKVVLLLTFLLHFVSTIALSVRIVGIRTGKMAASYAVYNIIFLVARFVSTFQAPLLAKHVESSILSGAKPDNLLFFELCFVSFLGSILGAFFIPTIQRFMYKAVEKAYQQSSVLKVIVQSIHIKTLRHIKETLTVPSQANIIRLRQISDMPITMIVLNVIVSSFITVSVLSCLYAGYLEPNLRSTSLSLNGFIVGLSTIITMIVVEPHIGITADKVINGEFSEVYFRRYIIFVVLARIVGTGLSYFMLIPLAHLVVWLAKSIFG